mmetsp:Transcript_10356/g.29243  ORF Transcript_10356/g.29243 Transcript_10356/m.29243 type:complete len:291 (+) Transcript_10356:1623-2495(+)
MEAGRLELDEQADEVAAEERIRVGRQHARADHLGHERAGGQRAGVEEPLRLLPLQARHDLLVVVLLRQLLFLELSVEVLQSSALLFQGSVISGMRVVALAVHGLLRGLDLLDTQGDLSDCLVIAFGRREDVLQRETPKGDVERHGESVRLEQGQVGPDDLLQFRDRLLLLCRRDFSCGARAVGARAVGAACTIWGGRSAAVSSRGRSGRCCGRCWSGGGSTGRRLAARSALLCCGCRPGCGGGLLGGSGACTCGRFGGRWRWRREAIGREAVACGEEGEGRLQGAEDLLQ